MRCVDQEDKEINRLSQTNNQLQELTTSLKNTAQGISSAIEENRQSLAEKLHNLEQTILPFKEATIKQETTLSQFSDDFAQLQISLGNIQTHLGSTIENLDKLPVKITTIISDINTIINRNNDVSTAFKKEIDQSFSDTDELINQIYKSFSERLELINDKIAENHQHIQSFHRKIHEENLQFQKNQGIAIIERFNELQFRSIKISKWNTILAVVNLLVLSGYLTFTLMNFRF